MTTRRKPPFGPAALIALLALGACGQIGDPIEAIGGRRPVPDEFKVLPRKPLVVPAAVADATAASAAALPTPEPGKPSPLEPDPAADAVAALTGTAAAPRPTATTSLSSGEAALLGAASAGATSPDIRVQLETDRTAAAEADAAEYEPPTVFELFGFGGDEEELDPALALDPIAESQRLQREGISAPSDPEAVAPTGTAEEGNFSTQRPPDNPDIYGDTPGRRPENPLQGRNTTPAFE
ncbi:MAG: DUF3035 domain-containing protein [Thermohalobaculum sp.]|nr:DUF3035 domain-containing protein [Thermohalobaculum sp.]